MRFTTRRLIAFAVLAVLAVASLAPPAEAQQCRPGQACHQPAYSFGVQVSAPVYQPATVQHQATYQASTSYGGSCSAALTVINAARAAAGRAPLPFDPSLAAWASQNVANPSHPHNRLAPGAGQCTAFVADPVAAAHQWLNSPSHRAILMNATTSIGIASCPGGVTANAR